MELNKDKNSLFYLTVLTLIVLGTLGLWWMILLLKVGGHANFITSNIPTINQSGLVGMLLWEGLTFLILLVIIGILISLLLWKNQQKTKLYNQFFAALSHELRTPLTSIQLQAELLHEKIQKKLKGNNEETLTKGLLEDTTSLISYFEKLLEISKLNRESKLRMVNLSFRNYFLDFLKRNAEENMNIEITGESEDYIFADPFALDLIFKNLIENSKKYGDLLRPISLHLEKKSKYLTITYKDHGQFQGNPHNLGKAFYKGKIQKGQGLGLFICFELIKKMKGKIQIISQPEFMIILSLRNPKGIKNG